MPRRNSEWRLTGGKVLVMLIAFFGIVIGVNATMARLAVSTLPGTDVDNPYSEGLAYDKEIAAARDQSRRNWKVDAHIERHADGTAALDVLAKAPDGSPLAGLSLLGRLERPTDRRADQAFDIAEGAGGSYHGIARGVAPGQWELVIEADRAGKRMFLSRNRIVLN
ncbi:MAG TPA: FixH family protein [Bradyrhizobium sp.]|uniref:FixH family protein n=1 Tax=Bradyrhizobium sp. TaxID=376 RepID=UPI002CBB0CFE|nr:FixH family protein [Bradyrhizobium sp.]HLZ01043.1 FixH family protein [Bradyrhizobium sp.]